MRNFRVVLDPTACDGHGICAALLPEAVTLDDWGYPVVRSDLPPDLVAPARRAAAACPALALRIVRVP